MKIFWLKIMGKRFNIETQTSKSNRDGLNRSNGGD